MARIGRVPLRPVWKPWAARTIIVPLLLAAFVAMGVQQQDELVGSQRTPVYLASAQSTGSPIPGTLEILAEEGASEVSISVNPLNNKHLVIAHHIGDVSGSDLCYIHYSRDGGLTWVRGFDPWFDECLAFKPGFSRVALGDPFVAFDKSGNVYWVFLLALNNRPPVVGIAKSTDGGATFQYLRDLAAVGSEVVYKSGDRVPLGRGVDFPKVAVDTSSSAFSNRVYVTFSSWILRPGTIILDDVQLIMNSPDGGATWSPILVLSGDTPGAPAFWDNPINIGVDATGHIYVPLGSTTGTGLYVLTSEDGGRNFTTHLAVPTAPDFLCIGITVENGCVGVFSGAAANPSADGPVYVFFRAQALGSADFDVYVARSDDAGATWTRPVLVNADTSGVDEQRPFASIAPDGRLDIIWASGQFSSPTTFDANILHSFSFDRGATFASSIQLTPGTRRIGWFPGNDYWTIASRERNAFAAYAYAPADSLSFAQFSAYVNVVSFETVFSDNFDDCNIGDWTVSTGTGNLVETSNTQSFSAPCSMHILKADGASNPAQAGSKKIDLNYSDEYYLDLRFYLPINVVESAMIVANDGRIRASLKPIPGGTSLCISGTCPVAVTHGVWHRLTVFYHPSLGTYTALLDGAASWDGLGFAGLPAKQLSLGTDCTSCRKVRGEVFYDDVRYVGSRPAAATLFIDNFNDGTLSPWTASVGTGNTVQVSSTRNHSAQYGLFVSYKGPNGPARATSPTINLDSTKNYTITLWFHVPSAQTVADNWLVLVDDSRVKIRWSVTKLVVEGTGVITTLARDMWHQIEIRARPTTSNFEFLVDGVSYGTFAFYAAGTATTLSLGSEASPSRKSYGDAFWDDIAMFGFPS